MPTTIFSQYSLQSSKSPRLRGEHFFVSVSAYSKAGSPPPTRGTLQAWHNRIYTDGITPAYAGNTQVAIFLNLHKRDHPRLRGEHESKYVARMEQGGLPPPTRGTQFYFLRFY